ncbi:type II toxin-antitoxin system VapC family toxin [Bosea sp. 685]|uniref:type II toxin-antitoxin system VapC family toxin n=1 Tax=Bosea sp. 685 TaxID=3080057 RepID=UPI0028930292|nr:type II toxin-antitoxin system VapC family toxin [Bosea sp. 685]WNJ89313.1 type II toxin-antitoxin system VapC family toxin [Bosea sp. 685]
MTYLLDTNVVSELVKPSPWPSVSRFVDEREDQLYISVVTLAEIRYGVASLDHGRKRQVFEAWLEHDLPDRFGDRILGIDPMIAKAWGDLMALSQRRGANVQTMDGLLAATAHARGLVLVTRNTRDFARLDLDLFDPWQVR